MQNKKSKWLALALILSFILILSMPIISAKNIPLTDKEINTYGKDEFGLLSDGHFYDVFTYIRNDKDETITFETEIELYNTFDFPVEVSIVPREFPEERIHETIRPNYTYYNFPDFSWITHVNVKIINKNCKDSVKVLIEMPVDEAYKYAKGGGYIFMIVFSLENAQVNVAPAYKIFITLLDSDPDAEKDDSLLSSIRLAITILFIVSFLIILVLILKYYIPKKFNISNKYLSIILVLSLIFVSFLVFKTQVKADNESISCSFNPHFESEELQITNEYPQHSSTEISRPPTNLSAEINGTGMDIYIYFYNITPVVDTWQLLSSWNTVDSGRYEVEDLSTLNGTTEFIWGNTEYTWSVNITNGTSWNNETYTYTTNSIADRADARYDVNNDDMVDIQDALLAWTHRDGQSYEYDGLYDVAHVPTGNGAIDIQDALFVWNNRSTL